MPTHIRIPASALRRGDILTPTNREVTEVYGCSHAPWKIDVWLRRAEPEGNDKNPSARYTFNRRTMVTVLRNA